MDFKEYFILHAKKHSCLMPQDVAKFCYQAALGAEHLLTDIDAARRYFDAEFEQVEENSTERLDISFGKISSTCCKENESRYDTKAESDEYLKRQ